MIVFASLGNPSKQTTFRPLSPKFKRSKNYYDHVYVTRKIKSTLCLVYFFDFYNKALKTKLGLRFVFKSTCTL